MTALAGSTISALSFAGLSAVAPDGKPARFALLDEAGNVIASGAEVAQAAFQTSVEAYRNFLLDKGHVRAYSRSEALAIRDGSATASG